MSNNIYSTIPLLGNSSQTGLQTSISPYHNYNKGPMPEFQYAGNQGIGFGAIVPRAVLAGSAAYVGHEAGKEGWLESLKSRFGGGSGNSYPYGGSPHTGGPLNPLDTNGYPQAATTISYNADEFAHQTDEEMARIAAMNYDSQTGVEAQAEYEALLEQERVDAEQQAREKTDRNKATVNSHFSGHRLGYPLGVM